jgi:transposase InsO family protein
VAQQLIAQAIAQQGIAPGQLTVHADRGSSMTSKPVAFLLADLGVTKTHSRPYTSTDNPYSEAQFKTLKYRPDFPARFDSILRLRRQPRTLRARLTAAAQAAHRRLDQPTHDRGGCSSRILHERVGWA